MKKIRSILGIILSMVLLLQISTITFAEEPQNNQEKVLLTEELAIEMASNYADVFTDKELVPCNPTKIYEVDGQAIGYIIELYYQNSPYGYLVFDSNVEGLLTEIALDNSGNTPEKSILKNIPTTLRSSNISDEKVYKLDTAIYGIPTKNSNEFITNYNDTIKLPEANIDKARSNKPDSWDDVFIDEKYNASDIFIASSGHIPEFIAYGESLVESETGHYACLVSAAMICAAYYGCASYGTLADDYMELWDLTNTSVYKTENGVKYGSTNPSEGVSGFKIFCNQKAGLNISSSDIWNPTLTFFRTMINRGDIGIVHCGLGLADGRSGHSMAVEGYAQIMVNGTMFNTAMVANGWDEGVHYLNLDSSQYSDIKGTAFQL